MNCDGTFVAIEPDRWDSPMECQTCGLVVTDFEYTLLESHEPKERFEMRMRRMED